MRRSGRRTAAAVVVVAGLAVFAPTSVAVAGGDDTAPYGVFGFTTHGLGSGHPFADPTVAISPDGADVTVATPGAGGVNVWYSWDSGSTWSQSKLRHGGNGAALDYLPNGTLLTADVTADQSSGEYDAWVSRSDTDGAIFDNGRAAGTAPDRPWFAHTPDGSTEFLAYHDALAKTELIARSTDGGQSWTTAPQDQSRVVGSSAATTAPSGVAAPAPGAQVSAADQTLDTFSGPMLVSPAGADLYVVYGVSDLPSTATADTTTGAPMNGPLRSIVVAHSTDGGSNWTNRYAVVPAAGVALGPAVPWGFVDTNGTLYVVYDSTDGDPTGEHYRLSYIYSQDKGQTWSAPARIDALPVGHGSVAFATGEAASPGVIDVAWLQDDTTGINDSNGAWTPYFAQISSANTSAPMVIRQPLTTVPNHRGAICMSGASCTQHHSLGDFLQLAMNPVSRLATITYADDAGQRPGGSAGEVVVAAQTAQPPITQPPVLPETPSTGLLMLIAALVLGATYFHRRRPGDNHTVD